MSDPFPAPASTREIPGQRSPRAHPMRPDLPRQRVEAPDDYVRFPFEAAPEPARAAAGEAFAGWHLRVTALLIDLLLLVPFGVAVVVGVAVAFDGGGLTRVDRPGSGPWNDEIDVVTGQLTTSSWVGLSIAALATLSLALFPIWNMVVRQGRLGASLGKESLHLMVVSERDGRPVGAFTTLVRSCAHVLDLLPLGLGYLWPLWSRERRTFADMFTGTVVLHVPPVVTRSAPALPAQITPTYDW